MTKEKLGTNIIKERVQFGKTNSSVKHVFVLNGSKDDEKLIEVFDVLIKTPTQLVITDPVTKADILHEP